ncbi:MAG: LexA regulated protein [Oceanospirillaceae bacterium]|uniref:LexA regulated protein n=1 Tax=unclassified Thalassolituus TaxID=2624967 RepID=UPI000C0BAF6E|nr:MULTISPECIES: LexA regulated protein [unclassified Thalassolituus]MAK90659.1 LexA regulated protein [Thalassolituus sp.]MAS24980.1 LexA regulated protein [Oceanospirillaceae bacterium]MAX99090.1 LexA regulated protein [Oceanospirillaceae bacterium]MBS53193.1 LexA regulated protein [Oceanospirillaceae bacterium]|tara:strand:+ start:1109 stop:1378 length:270 start_codon:yes stop_codon:yes gene_type:complete
MSIQPEDRTTIDMFSATKRGRPRSNPYDRNQQLRINKRVQRQRDKAKGLARLEIKLSANVIDQMDIVGKELGLSRAEIMELALKQWLHL